MKSKKLVWSSVPRILRMAVIFLPLLFFDSCIELLDVKFDEEVKVLIVEGEITTLPGPQKVRLSRSARFDRSVLPVNDARVIIRDQGGNDIILTEEIHSFFDPSLNQIVYFNSGVYATVNNFSAEIGKSYTLLVTTASGIEFTSLPEKIIPATEIVGLHAEFTKIPLINNGFASGFNIYVTIQDRAEEQNFYMWKNTGIYQITTHPEDHVDVTQMTSIEPIPIPKDCCTTCWVDEVGADKYIRVLSDNNVNGNLLIDQAAFIEDDRMRFRVKYMVRIEQHTINRDAFQYFNLLRDQLSINGDIFDPPPATLRGNMINLNNPDENVIGYFRASDVKIDSMFLTYQMLIEPRPILKFNDDCREYLGGTTERPSYW